MSTKKKIGFLGRYMANNVNLADPATSTKWKALTHYTQQYKSEALDYDNIDAIGELLRISQVEDAPDKLMAFGRNLEEFLNTADRSKLKNDMQLLKLIELYSETTIASNDKRAIDLAKNIMEGIIEIREG